MNFYFPFTYCMRIHKLKNKKNKNKKFQENIPKYNLINILPQPYFDMIE